MTRRFVRNITLIALIVSCFLQIGAHLFGVSVIVRVLRSAPPRSLAILEGPYRYDSSAFWQIVPVIPTVLLLVALIGNWKGDRRKLLLVAFGLFVIGGVIAGVYLEPMFATITSGGYRNAVDPDLQARAATWYAMDCAVWVLGLAGGITAPVRLARSSTNESMANQRA